MVYVLAGSNLEVRALIGERMEEIYGGISHNSSEAFATRGVAFLQVMACRETMGSGFSPQEIAGLAAGGLADGVLHPHLGEVTETCGMGADIGFGANFAEYKTVNASTLSALVLAAMGIPSVKHGSYGNTTKVASTDAVTLLGIPTVFADQAELVAYFAEHGFVYLEACATKTIHDLSHLIKTETVNHLVGPMSVPISSATVLNKVIGLNHHMSPRQVVLGYNEMHRRGIQTMGGIIAVCGLPDGTHNLRNRNLFRSTVLDEVSPFSTLVAVGQGGAYYGSALLVPSDFGVKTLPIEEVMVLNVEDRVEKANRDALRGQSETLANYLAMNAALAYVATNGVSSRFVRDVTFRRKALQDAFEVCRDAIMAGKVWSFVETCRQADFEM